NLEGRLGRGTAGAGKLSRRLAAHGIVRRQVSVLCEECSATLDGHDRNSCEDARGRRGGDACPAAANLYPVLGGNTCRHILHRTRDKTARRIENLQHCDW